jgi:hypothetical protein
VIVPVIVGWYLQCQPKVPESGSGTSTVSVVPAAMSWLTLLSSSVKLCVGESLFVIVIETVVPAVPVICAGLKAKF